MLNLFLGFSGRLRRRDFILWSILVPLVLIFPPAISVAMNATDLKTSLSQDLAAAGMMETFIGLIILMNYISLALFWKRMNDVNEETRRKRGGGIMRWGYAVLTVLNTLIVCGNMAVDGEIEGSAAGFVLMAFWMVACWLKPQDGENASGLDPRSGTAARDFDEPSPVSAQLDAGLQRALAGRNAHASGVLSPKLARAPHPQPSEPAGRPTFGKRG
jgi:uncharacterized membrane protein YhaH (DUF805 family)